MLSGRPLAFVLLAWSLVRVTFERLFTRGTPGLERFRENYDPDRLAPRSDSEPARIKAFSGCIACGRCDVGEAGRIAASRGEYAGLMRLVLASSRSMPDFDAATRALHHVPDDVLRAKEEVCPTAVPFADLARFVREKAAETEHPALPARFADGAAEAAGA